MPDALTNRESARTAMFLVLILVGIVAVVSFILGGVRGLIGIIQTFIIISLIVAFIAFVVYVVWYLFFKKHPRHIPYENWKSYLKAARDNGADLMDDLVLTGDRKHAAKRFMKIMGYLRVTLFDGKEYDLFVGKRNPKNPFEEFKIVILAPEEHSDLIGDVYVEGISFVLKYGFYFLNTSLLNFDLIDRSVAMDTYRTLMYETLGDMKGLIDRATGLDAEFRREQMQQKLLKIPTLPGQQPPPPPNQPH